MFALSSMAPVKLPLGKELKGDKGIINMYIVSGTSFPELTFYKEHLKKDSASPEETVDG